MSSTKRAVVHLAEREREKKRETESEREIDRERKKERQREEERKTESGMDKKGHCSPLLKVKIAVSLCPTALYIQGQHCPALA